MVAAVAVETRQKAKRNKAAAAAEAMVVEKTTPAAAVQRPRQPTPDHPPYCWMIGEAIDALGEDGGSAEDAISRFILAAYPGVPTAHDRFLRHYLAKHVAEGFFVCTAPGRYARSADETAEVEALEEPAAAGSSEAAVETPVAQVKRGRGRPRKDGSSSTPPASKKDGSAGSALPKRRRGRPRRAAPLVSGDCSAPSSSVAAAGKDGGQAKDGSSSTPPASMKDGSAPPKRRGRPRRAAPLAPGDCSVPSSSVAASEKNGGQATASAPKRRSLHKLGTITNVSGNASDKDEDGIDAPSTTVKELALMVVGDGLAAAPAVVNNVCGEASAPMPVDNDLRHELALVTITNAPAPMPTMDKQDDGEAASFSRALVVKHDGVATMSTAPDPTVQGCVLALVAGGNGPVPLKYKSLRQRPQASPMVIARQGSTSTSAAGKKVRGKALSAAPNAKGHLRQGAHSAPTTIKLTPVTTGGGNANGAPSAAPMPQVRMYPLTADEVPVDPSWFVLALPATKNV